MKFKKALYWFTNDLRLSDNEALASMARQAEQACFLYIIDTSEANGPLYLEYGVSEHRKMFTLASLQSLAQVLFRHGHQLHILAGDKKVVISQVIQKLRPEAVFMTKPCGYNARSLVAELKHSFQDIHFAQFKQFTLFDLSQWLDEPSSFQNFTRFRIDIESSELKVDTLASSNLSLNLIQPDDISFVDDVSVQCSSKLAELNSLYPIPYFKGGEYAAQAHLQQYFSSLAPSTYKQTRNALDQWSSSTKLSAYLANGCLSAKQVWQAVESFEREQEKNESTYWIKFELLWREYFQWLSILKGASLFHFSGTYSKAPLTSFYPERFAKWITGSTPYPIVNACMKQLRATGYMSNRGRQLVASCLVNELAIDWRYGAAYFEQQLVDYDVASNWGNWQYVAGVGVDPRGGRRFNLTKQTELYDPNHKFIAKWSGEEDVSRLDSQNEVDWPESCEH